MTVMNAPVGCAMSSRGRPLPWGTTRRSQAPEKSYTVRRGDTLYGIARRFGVMPQALARANRIRNPHALAVGRRLVVPTKAGGSLPNGSASSPPSDSHLAWPVKGVLTSPFGARHGRPHDGIDIGAPKGTQVRAADDGEVVYADHHRGYGNLVIVQHDHGLLTVYAHHEANLVRPGQHVLRGEVLARVGATGNASGPHLHFEVRHGTRPQNPMRFLRP